MKDEIENIINESIEKVREELNSISKKEETLEKIKKILFRKNKLKVMLLEEEKTTSKLDLLKLKRNEDLLEKEILLIDKKKLKVEKDIENEKRNLKNLGLELRKKGLDIKESDLLKSLIYERYKIYSKNFKKNRYRGDKIPWETYYKLVNKKYKDVYILDTNIFIFEPKILSYISSDILIIISRTVIDELDGNKHKKEIAFNVREAIRNIFSYEGENLLFSMANRDLLPEEYKISGDNLILSVGIKFKEFNPIIITEDIAFNIKAKMEGINTKKLEDIKSHR